MVVFRTKMTIRRSIRVQHNPYIDSNHTNAYLDINTKKVNTTTKCADRNITHRTHRHDRNDRSDGNGKHVTNHTDTNHENNNGKYETRPNTKTTGP